MADVVQIWNEALPKVRNAVTGVGVWTALNACKPLIYESGTFVLGVPHTDSELIGHLRIPGTKRLMELAVAELMNQPVSVRVIDGDSMADWELEKRRDAEKARLNELAMKKMRAELQAHSNWEQIYEQLGRKFAAVANKSLPQNRARFFDEAVGLIADARREQTDHDDLQERNFARCLERLAQYTELPSAYVATQVLIRAGEL